MTLDKRSRWARLKAFLKQSACSHSRCTKENDGPWICDRCHADITGTMQHRAAEEMGRRLDEWADGKRDRP